MPLDIANVVNLQITRATRVPSVAGFSTIAIFSQEAPTMFGADVRVKTYNLSTALADMATDGFSTDGVTYKAVQAVASQSPRPVNIRVIAQKADAAKRVEIEISLVAAGDYTITIDGDPYTQTEADASRTQTAILSDLATKIDAGPDKIIVGGVAQDKLTLYAAVGVDFSITVSENMTLTETSAVINAVGEINAARDENDDWYFLIETANDEDQIKQMAAHFETIQKLYFYQTYDSDTLTKAPMGDTTTIAAFLKNKSYDRTIGVATLTEDSFSEFKSAAWTANRAVTQPGSTTWKFKSLRGVSPDNFSTQVLTNIAGKNLNSYVTLGGTGINIFQEGVVASGEYIDIMRGTDALTGRIQQLVLTLLTTEGKVPFTDAGIETVGLQVERALNEYVNYGLLVGPEVTDDNDESLGPQVTVPTRSQTSASDRAKRELTNVTFTANYAGAVHKATIMGTVSV